MSGKLPSIAKRKGDIYRHKLVPENYKNTLLDDHVIVKRQKKASQARIKSWPWSGRHAYTSTKHLMIEAGITEDSHSRLKVYATPME